MADVALLAPNVTDAPESYQVPGAQEIIVKSVRAHFDGTSAAGSFVPCLRLLDGNGNAVAECPISTTLAAGAQADVSWFPGVDPGSATSSGGKTTVSPMAGGPPASPSNGDIWIATEVDPNDVIAWAFVYESSFTYPWLFIGGAPWFEYWSGVATSNTANSAWEIVKTTEPRLTLPRSGLYSYEWGGVFELSAATNAFATMATSVSDAAHTPYSWTTVVGSTTFAGRGDDSTRGTPRTAGDLLAMYIQSTIAADVKFLFPWAAVTPIAVS